MPCKIAGNAEKRSYLQQVLYFLLGISVTAQLSVDFLQLRYSRFLR
jgi:hypothetical protein